MTFQPSAHQQAYFDWIVNGTGSAVLVAVAGAGKTTTVLHGCVYMTGRVWLGVYNRKNGDEMKVKIAAMPELRDRTKSAKDPNALFPSTFHGAGYSALRFAFGKQHALKVDDKKCLTIAEGLAADRPDLQSLAAPVARIVGMAKCRGLGALQPMGDVRVWEEMVSHFDLDGDLPEDARMDQVVKFAQVVLKRSNEDLDVIDYDDMVYLPLQRKLRLLKHEWVIVDEAQDTNPTRRAMARGLLAPGGRLVAVGDPHQAIFGFTGADNDSLEQIAREHKCCELPLTVTYRCPRAVVAHAQRWVSHITAHESAPEGAVRALPYAELTEAVQPGDAIVCRYNRYLVSACFALIRAGKPAKIEGRAIGEGLIKLASRWKVKKLETLGERLTAYLERETTKALARDDAAKADRISDQVETLRVLLERAAAQKLQTVAELQTMIRGMFEDAAGEDATVVVLCSAHRAKGLEWDRVFVLGRAELMPARFATKPWQVQQELNLIYVACTRAKAELIEVSGVVVERRAAAA
jgi:DNA helicase-2/ATP-dependent DNA helicase PcrA